MAHHNDVIFGLARDYVIDSQVALSTTFTRVHGFIRARDIRKLATCATLFDPALHGVEVLKALRQVEAFFKKNASIDALVDKQTAALTTFKVAEERCKRINRKLYHHYRHPGRQDPELDVMIRRMQEFIKLALGDIRTFYGRIPRLANITSGATYDTARRKSQPYKKARPDLSCVKLAVPMMEVLTREFGYVPHYKPCEFNRVITVAKNWKTDRTIACEPAGSIPLQVAFDQYTKRRLLKFGVNLSDQSLNQRYAYVGSMNGQLATIDISSASDSVALNAVSLLFPEDWCQFLNALRAPYYSGLVSGRYHKFSSMGNGVTFCVETLIFLAAVKAVKSKVYAVYGDDIIVESGKALLLIELLSYFGFRINQDKTFITGFFRESCGEDFYHGVRVTPRYINEWSTSVKPILCHNINVLSEVCKPHGLLAESLASLIRLHKLPITPWTEDTHTGVHVLPYASYRLSRMRSHKRSAAGSHPWTPQYKGYLSKVPSEVVCDSRTLFIWYLNSTREKFSGSYKKRPRFKVRELNERVSSVVPAETHKYAFKWVDWVIPTTTVPDHLYWWSSYALDCI